MAPVFIAKVRRLLEAIYSPLQGKGPIDLSDCYATRRRRRSADTGSGTTPALKDRASNRGSR